MEPKPEVMKSYAGIQAPRNETWKIFFKISNSSDRHAVWGDRGRSGGASGCNPAGAPVSSMSSGLSGVITTF